LIHENYLFLCLRCASTLTFDLHEYEVLKDQLFNFFLLNCKKKHKKNIVDQVQRKQIYIEQKK